MTLARKPRLKNSDENANTENMTVEERIDALEGELDDFNLTSQVQAKDITVLRARVDKLADDIDEISEGASAEDLANLEEHIANFEEQIKGTKETLENQAVAIELVRQSQVEDIEAVRQEISTYASSCQEIGEKLESLKSNVDERLESVKQAFSECDTFAKKEELENSTSDCLGHIENLELSLQNFVKTVDLDTRLENTVKSEYVDKRVDEIVSVTKQSLNQQIDSIYDTLHCDIEALREEYATSQLSAVSNADLEELRGAVNSIKESLEGADNLADRAKEVFSKVENLETILQKLQEDIESKSARLQEEQELKIQQFNDSIDAKCAEKIQELEEKTSEAIASCADEVKSIKDKIETLDERFLALGDKAQEAEDQVLSQMETVRMALRLVEQLDEKTRAIGSRPMNVPAQPVVANAPTETSNGIIVTDADIEIPNISDDFGYELADVLGVVVEHGASDLHIKVGVAPMVRLHGELVPVGQTALTQDDAKALVFSSMNKAQRRQLMGGREVDFAYSCEGVRYRVNAFMERGNVSAAFRTLRTDIATLDSLGLPEVLKKLAMNNNGIILVTGPAGSGKSTTLAGMLDYINENRKCHVVTIEDPIEFFHKDKMSIITQREVGLDTPSFVEALRMSLRQDPNVIMIGEMRDAETMMTAVTAAETGHLVLSTLHTPNAVQAVDRIIDTFSGDLQKQFRMLLSSSLRGVVSQKLLVRADGNGRVAATEIMVNTPTISSLILEGKTNEIYQFIKQGANDGMQTFTQSMLQLCMDGIITKEEGMSHADQPTEFRMGIEGHVATNTASQTEMDTNETMMKWL